MEIYITTIDKNGKQMLGSNNQTLVHDCKSFVKINNRLKWFTQYDKDQAKAIEIYSYTNFYDDKTFKLLKTITL